MSVEFRGAYSIGSRVLVYGAVGTVIGVTFSMRAPRPQYEVRFDSGGANSVVDESDLAPAKVAA